MSRLLLLPLLLVGCTGEVGTSSGRALCNGVLDPRETTVDDLFDGDGDGFVDAANPQCQQAYDAAELDCNDSDAAVSPGQDELTCDEVDNDCDEATADAVDADADGYSICDGDCADGNPAIAPGFAETACDGLDNDCDLGTFDSRDADADGYSDCDDCVDSDPDIHPGLSEQACDGVDNDCDAATVDGLDQDGDGSTDCFDCDDQDPTRRPGLPDVCEDGIDQNCDGADATCAQATWAGNWATNAVSYTCGGGNVDVDFQTVSVIDATPNMTFIFVGSAHPGSMIGQINGSNAFTAASSSSGGGCNKSFYLSGSFTGANAFTATLDATFSGCSGCANQSWTVAGSR